MMPTGTGKTETMLCSVVHYRRGPTLVIVPNNRLRWQTFGNFRSLGLLRKLRLVDDEIHNPIVSVITKEPNCAEDLSIFEGANVVIGVMASLGVKDVAEFRPQIAAAVKSLFVDEAHHVPSDTWSEFRSQFARHQVVQFTATPFRLDNKLVDGRVIFSYSPAVPSATVTSKRSTSSRFSRSRPRMPTRLSRARPSLPFVQTSGPATRIC